MTCDSTDIMLVGSGAMSSTQGSLLKQIMRLTLIPNLKQACNSGHIWSNKSFYLHLRTLLIQYFI